MEEVQIPEVANRRGNPISPVIAVLAALRFYATGHFHRENGELIRISESAACRKLHEVTAAIVALKPQRIQFPSFVEQQIENHTTQQQRGQCMLDSNS